MSVSSILDPSTGKIADQFLSGGGANPTFDSVNLTLSAPSAPVASSSISSTEPPFGGATNILGVFDLSGNQGPLYAGGGVVVQEVGPTSASYNRMYYSWNGLSYQQPSTGASFPILEIDGSNSAVDLTNIATINGAPYPPTGGGASVTAVDTPILVSAIPTTTTPLFLGVVPHSVPSGSRLLITATLNFTISTMGTPPGPLTDIVLQLQSQSGTQTFPLSRGSSFLSDPNISLS